MTDLLQYLHALGIHYETHHHPAVFTVEQSRAHWAEIDGAHTKNLLLKDAGGAFWLVVLLAEATPDLKGLSSRIGSRLVRFASPDDLRGLLGVESGAVSAFALINDHGCEVRLVLDRRLTKADRIALHPLDNTRTTVVATVNLLRFLGLIDVKPMVADLA